MALWQDILLALWLFLPGYVANMSPVFTSKLLPKWKTPIDFGATHADGRRALGDGKTWRGLLGGGIAAGICALLQSQFQPSFLPESNYNVAVVGPFAVFVFGLVMGLGALIGDAIESYAKRRKGKDRGAPWFPFDQLDFVVFGLLFAFLFHPLLGYAWFWPAFANPTTLLTLLILTPALHLIINRVGYWLKLKEVPW